VLHQDPGEFRLPNVVFRNFIHRFLLSHYTIVTEKTGPSRATRDIFFSLSSLTNMVSENPVETESEGIKLRPEKMVVDKIYHCFYEDKIFLFYKDEQEFLHCYEVEDPLARKEISENPGQLESILRNYMESD
jgi:hypothetical protein